MELGGRFVGDGCAEEEGQQGKKKHFYWWSKGRGRRRKKKEIDFVYKSRGEGLKVNFSISYALNLWTSNWVFWLIRRKFSQPSIASGYLVDFIYRETKERLGTTFSPEPTHDCYQTEEEEEEEERRRVACKTRSLMDEHRQRDKEWQLASTNNRSFHANRKQKKTNPKEKDKDRFRLI